MNERDVEITVKDDLNQVVLSITLYNKPKELIEQQIEALKNTYILCEVEFVEI